MRRATAALVALFSVMPLAAAEYKTQAGDTLMNLARYTAFLGHSATTADFIEMNAWLKDYSAFDTLPEGKTLIFPSWVEIGEAEEYLAHIHTDLERVGCEMYFTDSWRHVSHSEVLEYAHLWEKTHIQKLPPGHISFSNLEIPAVERLPAKAAHVIEAPPPTRRK